MPRWLERLAAFNERVCNGGRDLAGWLLMAMTAIVLVQIVFRYVFNSSLVWSEEVAKALMVWSAFLVAPWGYRMGANVAIEMFVDPFSRRVRRALGLALNLLVLWIAGVFFVESFGFWQRGLDILAASLPIPMAVFYTIVPFAFAGLLAVGVELVARDLLSLLRPTEDYTIPGTDRPMEGE